MPDLGPPPNGLENPSGNAGRFDATRWSLVLRAQDESTAALNSLFSDYRRPLLAYLEGRGRSLGDPEDLLHNFFAALLRRDFLRKISAEKGRFRTFLLRALDNFLRDEADKAATFKSGAAFEHVSADERDDSGRVLVEPSSPGPLPDTAFDREWGLSILRSALRRLHEDYQRRGRAALCQALEPILFKDETAPAYRELATQFGMEEQALRTAASRMRGELKELIRGEILQTVTNPDDWEEECRHFMGVFGR